MGRKYSNEQLIKAYKCATNNKEELQRSQKCGCFSCLTVFYPYEIELWIPDETGTAVCPYCYMDAVIGDVFGHPITVEFLREMQEFWFPGFGNEVWGWCYWW